ncbi:MAG: hypothetical protein ACRDYC_08245 [Acidimicrobiales bacterium]
MLGSLLGISAPSSVADPLTAQAAIFGGALKLACHFGGAGVTVLVVDDVHFADHATLAWLRYCARRGSAGRLLLAVATRPGRPSPTPEAPTIHLGPLDLESVRQIVGADRAGALFARTSGNPLFLVELASADENDLPNSIVEAVRARCAQSVDSGTTLQTAAVLGSVVDLDLLSAVLQRWPSTCSARRRKASG